MGAMIALREGKGAFLEMTSVTRRHLAGIPTRISGSVLGWVLEGPPFGKQLLSGDPAENSGTFPCKGLASWSKSSRYYQNYRGHCIKMIIFQSPIWYGNHKVSFSLKHSHTCTHSPSHPVPSKCLLMAFIHSHLLSVSCMPWVKNP